MQHQKIETISKFLIQELTIMNVQDPKLLGIGKDIAIILAQINIETKMTLDEAIEHCREKSQGYSECAIEHYQLMNWLIELKEKRSS